MSESALRPGTSLSASPEDVCCNEVLNVSKLRVVYNGSLLALGAISLSVKEGQSVALLGPNGAGKSTTLNAISRLLGATGGAVTRGKIHYSGHNILPWDACRAVRSGIVQVLEGRHVFAQLTVEQNLKVAAYSRRASRSQVREDLQQIYQYFPKLYARKHSRAGFTSGGEQQMLAIGRALMLRPRLVLLDEPSMGLAPLVVEEIFEIIRKLNREEGVSFLLAEQNAAIALRYSDYAYMVETGNNVLSGESQDLARRDDVQQIYLGVGEQGGKKSFKDAKFYHGRERVFGM